MTIRWVLSPVIFEGGVRKPKVSTIVDPGRPASPLFDDDGDPVLDGDGNQIVVAKTLVHSSVISDGQPRQPNDWCVSMVGGVDLSLLDTDPDVIDLFEIDTSAANHQGLLDATLRQRGRGRADVEALKTRVGGRGIDLDAIDLDKPIANVIAVVAAPIRANCNPRGMSVGARF